MRYVGSSQTRDQTSVPCIGRQSLNQWVTRKGLHFILTLELTFHVLSLVNLELAFAHGIYFLNMMIYFLYMMIYFLYDLFSLYDDLFSWWFIFFIWWVSFPNTVCYTKQLAFPQSFWEGPAVPQPLFELSGLFVSVFVCSCTKHTSFITVIINVLVYNREKLSLYSSFLDSYGFLNSSLYISE